MGEVSTIGLDIAKSVFQVHGADVDGAVVIRSVSCCARRRSSSRLCRLALLALKLAPVPDHWSRELRRSAIRCG